MINPEELQLEQIYENFEMDLDQYFDNKVDLYLEDKAEKWIHLQDSDYEQKVSRRKKGY